MLDIVKQVFKIEDMKQEEDEWDIVKDVSAIADEKALLSQNDIGYLMKALSPFAWDDLVYCERRFYYSNILRHYPVYYEDFTQRITFGWLGKMFEEQRDGRQQVREQFIPLFPQWTEALKHNLVDTTPICKINQYVKFDNIKFPESMFRVWRLGAERPSVLTDSKKKKTLEDVVMKNAKNLKTEVDKRCYFCPHQLIWKEGGFAVDGSDE